MKGIARCRKRVKMSQAELAMLLGLTVMTISNYERGEREPSIETLKKMSEIFGVTVDELIAD